MACSENFQTIEPKREEWGNNVGKTAVIFLQIFREMLGTLARSLGLKLVGYKILIYLITGALNSSKFMQTFLDLYTSLRTCIQPSEIWYSRPKFFIAV